MNLTEEMKNPVRSMDVKQKKTMLKQFYEKKGPSVRFLSFYCLAGFGLF